LTTHSSDSAKRWLRHQSNPSRHWPRSNSVPRPPLPILTMNWSTLTTLR